MTKYIAAFLIALVSLSSSLKTEMLAVLPEVNNANMMDISGSELYIMDNEQIKVYSLKDYRFLRKFGQKGEGPGELLSFPEAPFTMIVHEEKVILNSVYKAIIYDKSGKMIKEVKFAPFWLVEANPIGKNYAATKIKWIARTLNAWTWILDPGMKEIKKIYETDLPSSYKTMKFPIPLLCTFARCAKDRIFIFDQQKDKIKVFDPQGNPLPDIKFPYEPIITTDAFREKVNYAIKTHPVYKHLPPELMKRFYTPDVLPVFRECRVIGDRLYIQTYRQKGDLSEFLIIDFSGKLIKKLFLPGTDRLQLRLNPGSTFAFQNGKYYYLVEDLDEEQWELHVMNVD